MCFPHCFQGYCGVLKKGHTRLGLNPLAPQSKTSGVPYSSVHFLSSVIHLVCIKACQPQEQCFPAEECLTARFVHSWAGPMNYPAPLTGRWMGLGHKVHRLKGPISMLRPASRSLLWTAAVWLAALWPWWMTLIWESAQWESKWDPTRDGGEVYALARLSLRNIVFSLTAS